MRGRAEHGPDMAWEPDAQPLGSSLDVVGVGEAMLLLQALPPATLTTASELAVDVAGAELNACAAIARLGGHSALLSRVGNDAPGERIRRAMTALGIDDRMTATDDRAQTGLFLRETPADGSRRVIYYRGDSAASKMDRSDAERLWEQEPPRALILSGITAALGAGVRELMNMIAKQARTHGTAVVVDVNLRPTLGSVTEVIRTLQSLLPNTALLVLGDDESGPLFGSTDPTEVFAAARAAGVSETVLKGGAQGCWYLDNDGTPTHMPSRTKTVVDPIGAGDAFLGGYLAARLTGANPGGAAMLGSELAAAVISAPGDTAGLPGPEVARSLIEHAVRTNR